MVDVPYHESLAGDTLRLWLPVPRPSQRQSDIRVIATTPAAHSISDPSASPHRSVYMEQPVSDGRDTHFDMTVEYTASAEYFDPEQILADMRPYGEGRGTGSHRRKVSPASDSWYGTSTL
mgnify:CR=1 FL=1